MNPTGILFGKNAVVDVQGSFVATTAHGIGFGSNLWFNALGPNDYANLTTSDRLVLGFNGPSGAIVNSGQIIASGNGFGGPAQLALVGSTVVNTGNLKARGEGIAIATPPPTQITPPPTQIAPPPITPPENSPGASAALQRPQKPTQPCIKSKQSPSSNCSPEEKSEAAILKILER